MYKWCECYEGCLTVEKAECICSINQHGCFCVFILKIIAIALTSASQPASSPAHNCMQPETSRTSFATTAKLALPFTRLLHLHWLYPWILIEGNESWCSIRGQTVRVYILGARFLCNQSHTGAEFEEQSWTFERLHVLSILQHPSLMVQHCHWFSKHMYGWLSVIDSSRSVTMASSTIGALFGCFAVSSSSAVSSFCASLFSLDT